MMNFEMTCLDRFTSVIGRVVIIIITSMISIHCYAQINYEKGYFINSSDETINCLIENKGWKNNPKKFKYKLTENSETKITSILDVKEFGVQSGLKYIRRSVLIDNSTDNLNKLGNFKTPSFVKQQMFLKVLVEGNANLYQYTDSKLNRFFYSTRTMEINQLVFKRYRNSNKTVQENNQYRQQLTNLNNCKTIEGRYIKNIRYSKSSLVKFFISYNECNRVTPIIYREKQKENRFNFSIRPRLNYSSLSIFKSRGSFKNTDFGGKFGFGMGVEVEYILPHNKNKWSIIFEPTYQNFNSEKTNEIIDGLGAKSIADVKYTSIETSIGARYYFFLSENSKLFINANYVLDFAINSTIEFERTDNQSFSPEDINSSPGFSFGVGYKINGVSVEFKYFMIREILNVGSRWESDYRTLSFIVGYSIF